jgi:hypothetical protein
VQGLTVAVQHEGEVADDIFSTHDHDQHDVHIADVAGAQIKPAAPRFALLVSNYGTVSVQYSILTDGSLDYQIVNVKEVLDDNANTTARQYRASANKLVSPGKSVQLIFPAPPH